MKIKFLGTGAAEGIPSTFCNCKICEYARRFKGMKTHNELCEMGNKYSFIVAYDGMEIEI